MAKYLDENGYFKGASAFECEQPFVYVLGGRGTGKTYGCTKWLVDNADEGHKFIFMRRTDAELSFIDQGNLYEEHSPDVDFNNKGKIHTVSRNDETIGYHIALSTIHNIRGFSMLDVSYILFDEFIAERGTVVRRFAGEQMLNAYETINRNRELKGVAPVKCVFLSNFNTAESDIMSAFGFEDEIYNLVNVEPVGVYTDETKKLIMLNDTPISSKKRETVLYKTTHDENYLSMAVENNGILNIMPIKHYSRKSYEFLGKLGNVNINRLWSGYYYLTENDEHSEPNKKDLLRYMVVYHAYILGNVYASNDYVAACFVNFYE